MNYINFSFYKTKIFLLKILEVNGMFLKALECLPQELFSIFIVNYVRMGHTFMSLFLSTIKEKSIPWVDMHHDIKMKISLRVKVCEMEKT